MDFLKWRTRTLLLVAGMAALLLPAARCGPPPIPVQGATINGSGPSSGISVVAGSGANWSNGSQQPTDFSLPLLTMINNYRAARGLPPLRWHDGMAEVALLHSKDMQARSFFGIVNPLGIDPYERMVSSTPRIDFDNAWAFVFDHSGTTGAGSAANVVYDAMVHDPVTLALIESTLPTHLVVVGNTTTHRGTIIFARNTRP